MRRTHVPPWSAYLMSAAVLLWVEGCLSAGQVSAKKIDCRTTAASSNCDFDSVCWVTCPVYCPTVAVYGTERYRYDSPICAAAGHDLRLSPWNNTTLTVAFRRSSTTLQGYQGSWRNGFTSHKAGQLTWPYSNSGWYYFVSPRIAEPILDLTSVHVHYRHGRNEDHVQFCFGSPGRQISFSHFGHTLSPYPKPTQRDGVFKIVWPVNPDGAPSGAFVCTVRGSVLSTATSVAMPRMPYYPDTLSQTISLNEMARLKNSNGGSTAWYKDGVGVSKTILRNRNSEVEVTGAKLGDGGLYTFRATAAAAGYEQASRLIVRACPHGKYGHGCKETCPLCQNGGACHDITGVCICPPGFTGQHCEGVCKFNHFGQNCSHNCTEVASLSGGSDPRCAGMLFCLPDPYGCSCYPGFSGIDCSTPCKTGTYGANCKLRRTCHCRLGEGCHPQSGVCSQSTCEEGYRDEPYCDRMYPVLRSFSADAISEESIEAQWSPWSRGDDKGEGEPDGYIIQFKEQDRMEWNRTDLIPGTGNGTLLYVITDLKPNTKYQVQVLVHDTSGHVHSRTVGVARTKTLCGAPLSPPHSFTYEEKPSRTTELKWQLPQKTDWQCDSVSTEVRVNDGDPYITGITKATFPTTPFTAYRIQARLVTRGEKYGPFSNFFEFTTAEAAPGEVTSLSVQRLSAKEYQFLWQAPMVANGNLRFYHLLIDAVGLHQRNCSEFQAPERINASVTANVTSFKVKNLMAGAMYRFSILATTVENGPWADYNVVTFEEVPEAPPRFKEPEVGDTLAQVSWREPDCRLANGVITGYRLVRSSTADWELSAVSLEVATNSVTMNDLTPFTEYTVTVSAENSVGTGPGANITFTTLPAAPPAPTNLTVYSASSEQLLVSWLPPYPPNGVLEHYGVYFKLVQETEFNNPLALTPGEASCGSEVRARHHCAVLSPLLPNMEYHVVVLAKNRGVQAWSEHSNQITAETRESKPGPPSHVYQEDRQETAVVVAWKEPSLSNGVILGYKVTLVNQNSPAAKNTSKEVGPEARQVQFDELSAGTAYVTEVSANTSAGYGKPVKIVVHTRPRVPVIETKIELKTVSETAITLQLAPVGDQPDDIKAYYVLVQRHDDHNNRTKRSAEDSSGADGGGSPSLHEWTGGTPDYNESVAMNLSFYMAANMTPDELKSQGEFTVGDGRYYRDYYNAPLIPEATYSVGLAAEVDFEGVIVSRIQQKWLDPR